MITDTLGYTDGFVSKEIFKDVLEKRKTNKELYIPPKSSE